MVAISGFISISTLVSKYYGQKKDKSNTQVRVYSKVFTIIMTCVRGHVFSFMYCRNWVFQQTSVIQYLSNVDRQTVVTTLATRLN